MGDIVLDFSMILRSFPPRTLFYQQQDQQEINNRLARVPSHSGVPNGKTSKKLLVMKSIPTAVTRTHTPQAISTGANKKGKEQEHHPIVSVGLILQPFNFNL